jgi:hypothetical protein
MPYQTKDLNKLKTFVKKDANGLRIQGFFIKVMAAPKAPKGGTWVEITS